MTRGTSPRNLRRSRRQVDSAGRPRPTACEVCGNTHSRVMHWDHNHATGRFRGWLCGPCNLTLGHSRDDAALLRKLADYLERSGPGPLSYTEWAASASIEGVCEGKLVFPVKVKP